MMSAPRMLQEPVSAEEARQELAKLSLISRAPESESVISKYLGQKAQDLRVPYKLLPDDDFLVASQVQALRPPTIDMPSAKADEVVFYPLIANWLRRDFEECSLSGHEVDQRRHLLYVTVPAGWVLRVYNKIAGKMCATSVVIGPETFIQLPTPEGFKSSTLNLIYYDVVSTKGLSTISPGAIREVQDPSLKFKGSVRISEEAVVEGLTFHPSELCKLRSFEKHERLKKVREYLRSYIADAPVPTAQVSVPADPTPTRKNLFRKLLS